MNVIVNVDDHAVSTASLQHHFWTALWSTCQAHYKSEGGDDYLVLTST